MTRADRGRSPRADEPKFIPPMECTPVTRVPDDPSLWLYEAKLDGYRCCAVVHGNGRAELYSRYGNPWPERFPKIHAALREMRDAMVLDGEVVAVGRDGRPSFQELQNWQSTRLPIVLYVFDFLHYRGEDLRARPIEERKAMLQKLKLSEPLRLAPSLEGDLPTIARELMKHGLEGIIAKKRGTRYTAGTRSRHWLKRRFNEVGEFVIGGYTLEGDSLARLLVGSWQGKRLLFQKKLKNGFNRYNRKVVLQSIEPLRVGKCPFANPEDIDAEDPVWVRPVRRCEVEFLERTASGNLRHAFFRQLID